MGNTKITEAEWVIMDIVWEEGQLKASDIIARLEGKETWNDKTIRTLIRRLVDKKVLGTKKEKFLEYYPLISRESCVAEETQSFIQKVYKGSVGLFISNFVKSEKLSADEIKELKKLLEEKE